MNQQQLLEKIKQAAREGATSLDLSFNNPISSLPLIGRFFGKPIDSLPAEIGQLSNLTSLDLRFNQLSSLPAEIGQLSNLTSLDLWG
ncbi:MAG: leucine-rich repeat domain-containing protein, partial [Cyanobacteria bacterium J06656_5]